MRIVQAFATGGPTRRLTAQQLAEALTDVPQATLYRHLKRLLEAGVLAIVESRQVRGAQERTYVLAQGAAELSPADLAQVGRADHMRYFVAFLAGLIGDFSGYLEGPSVDLIADGVGYRRVTLNLSDEELQRLVLALNQALLPFLRMEPTAERTSRVLATIMLPVGKPATATDPAPEPGTPS